MPMPAEYLSLWLNDDYINRKLADNIHGKLRWNVTIICTYMEEKL